jgi:hypothetical protein
VSATYQMLPRRLTGGPRESERESAIRQRRHSMRLDSPIVPDQSTEYKRRPTSHPRVSASHVFRIPGFLLVPTVTFSSTPAPFLPLPSHPGGFQDPVLEARTSWGIPHRRFGRLFLDLEVGLSGTGGAYDVQFVSLGRICVWRRGLTA